MVILSVTNVIKYSRNSPTNSVKEKDPGLEQLAVFHNTITLHPNNNKIKKARHDTQLLTGN